RPSSGTCRSPSGSSAASSTSPTTASTGTSSVASATRSPITWSASRAASAQCAYHGVGEAGDTRTITYADLQREVSKAANALLELGVTTGDRVAIYMPMIPELPIAMLACARIGAPHTVVFGGFSAEALAGRIDDSQAKLVITADGGWRRGKAMPLKAAVDEAVASSPTIEHVLMVRRLG